MSGLPKTLSPNDLDSPTRLSRPTAWFKCARAGAITAFLAGRYAMARKGRYSRQAIDTDTRHRHQAEAVSDAKLCGDLEPFRRCDFP